MKFLLCLLIFYSTHLLSEDERLVKGVTLDLRNPAYCDGVLTTSEGGVIEGPGIRIQARSITYTRKIIEDAPVCFIQAEGDLILDFGETYFIGESIEYNFQTGEGVLYQARTTVEPWFFGGDKVVLYPDGSFMLYNGFITTSESQNLDWAIEAENAYLTQHRYLRARNVKFRIYQIPFLWIPAFRTDLDSIFDAPIRYDFKWGGRQGVRGTMIYEIFNWNRFKTFVRADYRFKRGLGGGIETYYRSEDRKEIFNTINYFANDNSLSNEHEHYRYRFQGLYHNLVWDDRVSVDLTWDKLSDRDMATDYDDRGLALETAGRTQFLIRKQEETRIERFLGHVKINSFQSVKQELPTLEVSWRPKSLGNSGIISTSLTNASYLDFSYSNEVMKVHNFNSTRVEWRQSFLRPVPYCGWTTTPKLGFWSIYYGNSPQSNDKLLFIGNVGLETRTSLSKTYVNIKHVIEPYCSFDYFTFPTATPSEHYIFDIKDGWYQANILRLGMIHQIYAKSCCCISRPLFVDLYTYGFFDTPTIGYLFPKTYLTVTALSCSTLRHTVETAWDFQHNELDHFNIRTEWTVAENLAITNEYRHRSRYDWRKADIDNFILDAYRSEGELLHSQLSDRRDTFLMALYYQFNPNWAFNLEARHGWYRRFEPAYTEYQVDFIGVLRSAWNVKLSYQHREDDDRIAVYFSIGIRKPNQAKCESIFPCLEL